ncbi:MAG: DUF362 domain-containing protein, partial [Armatimonadetes bacterium]|nr:DUF362 domain-containing protein [Armatimonadota bacterium]
MGSRVHVARVEAVRPRGLATHNEELRSAAVEEAVADLCGATVSRELFRGARVVVKPNVFMPHAPATTDPRVTGGVIAWLLGAGAREVIVAEESSISTHIGRGSSTAEALAHTGYDRLVESFDSARVRLAELRSEGDQATPVPNGLVLREVRYPKLLAEADRLVNVPILKFHLQTLITNAIKNTWSVAEPLLRTLNHCWTLAAALLDAHHLRPPDLTVVDALQPLTGDHSFGEPLDWRLLMAGTDSVALDALGAWMLGFDDPSEVETVRVGGSFGETNIEAVRLDGIAKEGLPRAERPEVPCVPADFPPLEIEWHCGRRVGPGCVAYATAGLRALAQKAEGGMGRWRIFVGEAPEEPEDLGEPGERVLFIGACSLQGQVFRNVQRRLYLSRRSEDLIV